MTRTILTGILATCCIAATAAGLWWNALRGGDELAAVLPADAVLAYVHAPGNNALHTVIALVVPTLPAAPETDGRVTAAAAVRLPDGTEGWIIRTTNEFGAVRFAGSDPALEALIHATGATLAQEPAFRTLRWHDEAPWAYVAFPRASSNGSPFESVLALDTPLAARMTASGITLRQTADLPNGIASVPPGPRRIPQVGEHLILIPAWSDMQRIVPLLSVTAVDIIETVSRTFFDAYAHGLSMRYDASILLDSPSVLVLDTTGSGDVVFTWEGRGRTPADADRVLRAIHGRFAAARGGVRMIDTAAEGLSLRTITHESETETDERTDGEWTVLTTSTPEGILRSERNGARFVVTTAPATLPPTEGTRLSPHATDIAWTEASSARISPLWPSLQPEGTTLRSVLKGGPGYLEWTLEPVRSF